MCRKWSPVGIAYLDQVQGRPCFNRSRRSPPVTDCRYRGDEAYGRGVMGTELKHFHPGRWNGWRSLEVEGNPKATSGMSILRRNVITSIQCHIWQESARSKPCQAEPGGYRNVLPSLRQGRQSTAYCTRVHRETVGLAHHGYSGPTQGPCSVQGLLPHSDGLLQSLPRDILAIEILAVDVVVEAVALGTEGAAGPDWQYSGLKQHCVLYTDATSSVGDFFRPDSPKLKSDHPIRRADCINSRKPIGCLKTQVILFGQLSLSLL